MGYEGLGDSIRATIVVDYKQAGVFDGLADNSVDVVLDNFGAKGTADTAMRVIKPGGAFAAAAEHRRRSHGRHASRRVVLVHQSERTRAGLTPTGQRIRRIELPC